MIPSETNVNETLVGTSNTGFVGSMSTVTGTSTLHTRIVSHVIRADSNLSLSHDEVHSFEDEGMDSDVDDLSEIGSGDDEDWDRPDDSWDSRFTRLRHEN